MLSLCKLSENKHSNEIWGTGAQNIATLFLVMPERAAKAALQKSKHAQTSG